MFGLRACYGESFGYTYGTYLNEIDRNSELVMESIILWKGWWIDLPELQVFRVYYSFQRTAYARFFSMSRDGSEE